MLDANDCKKILSLVGFKGSSPCRDCGQEIWLVKSSEKWIPYSPNLDKHFDVCPNKKDRGDYKRPAGSSNYSRQTEAPF